jgi:hypothetical protein
VYSPSLFSAILHSFEVRFTDNEVVPIDPRWARQLQSVLKLRRMMHRISAEHQIPLVGRVSLTVLRELSETLRSNWSIDDRGPDAIVWGRTSIAALIENMEASIERPAEIELLDLGTPLRAQQQVPTALQNDCARLVALTATRNPTAGIAIVDRGDEVVGSSPDDYGGKVRHALTHNVVAGSHALQVLKIALERLDGNGTIGETAVACALVKPPANAIGLRCFEHANVTELLMGLQALSGWLSGMPWAVNVSLGAHVGPHNGESPLEEEVARMVQPGAGRFLVAAAGNDGMSGIAGRRELKAGVRDYLKVHHGSKRAQELFLEFWWQEPQGSPAMTMAIEAWPYDLNGTALQAQPIRIDAQRAGAALHSTTTFQGHTLSTLFQAPVRNGMSCAALAISNAAGLPEFDLEIGFEASHDVVVNGWIVVCTDSSTAFVEAGNEGTVNVPATAAGVLCVAGIDQSRRPWSRSSRGPSASYMSGNLPGPGAPHIAYLVDGGAPGAVGTSFAAPRATADAADVLRNPLRRTNCTDAVTLAKEMLAPQGGLTWNPRTGYGDQL